MEATKWWHDHMNLARLYRWLDDRGEISGDVDNIVYFLSKPWKWESEWLRMTAGDARQVRSSAPFSGA